jgi:hypothetical protein
MNLALAAVLQGERRSDESLLYGVDFHAVGDAMNRVFTAIAIRSRGEVMNHSLGCVRKTNSSLVSLLYLE